MQWPWGQIESKLHVVSEVLSVILLALKDAGRELLEYGSKEKQLQHRGLVDTDFSVLRVRRGLSQWDTSTIRLIGFDYGPEPEDWRLWWSEPTDEFAGEFWHMIENPWERIPGAWIDN